MRKSVSKEAFEFGYYMIRDVVLRKQPEYVTVFDDFFDGYFFYPCNLFVMPKIIMDEYCKWLFDIIIEVTIVAEVEAYDSYSKRILGFMAERLLTVWLIKQNYKIKELFFLLKE